MLRTTPDGSITPQPDCMTSRAAPTAAAAPARCAPPAPAMTARPATGLQAAPAPSENGGAGYGALLFSSINDRIQLRLPRSTPKQHGGAGGIRTLDTVLPYTHFPGERL